MSLRSRIPRAPVLAALAALAGACSHDAPPEVPAAQREVWVPPAPVNVVLILVDTLRGDVVGDPEGRYDSPAIDRLAHDGIAFPSAFSAAPMTLPSHMSLFSSRPPFETKVLNNGQNVPRSLPLVADWLAQHGYDTRAVISLGTLNPLDKRESPARGFASYDYDYWDMSRAEQTGARLSASLAARNPRKPLFLFAHFSDPHEPYNAHGKEEHRIQLWLDGKPLHQYTPSDMVQPVFDVTLTGGRNVLEFSTLDVPQEAFRIRRLEVSEDGDDLPFQWESGGIMERVTQARIVVDRGDQPDATCTFRMWINDVPPSDDSRRSRYASEVSYADHYIGELIEELDRLGLYQDSLVIFTADHGEAMGELRPRGAAGVKRPYFGHVEYLTDDQIHVPLILKLPRNDPRRDDLARVSARVTSQIDLVPTLLEVIGLPPLPGQRGISLFEPHQTVHMAETHRPESTRDQMALRDERFKMIYFPDEKRFEMYDLAADPGESTDVFERLKVERPAWPETLDRLSRQAEAHDGGESEAERQKREADLQALGYTGNEGPSSGG